MRRVRAARHQAGTPFHKPVFVDDSGRRALIMRWVAALVMTAVAVGAALFLFAIVHTVTGAG